MKPLPSFCKLLNHGWLVLELPLPDPSLHLPRGQAAVLRQRSGVNVKITTFSDFPQFPAKNSVFSSKTNVMSYDD
jgi:hypothetical protein